MVKGILTRALLVAVLALPLPGAVVAQDDAPQTLEALALEFIVQAEQIDQLHERIDNVRIGTLRDRIKALEVAVDELAGRLAAKPLAVVSATLVEAQEPAA